MVMTPAGKLPLHLRRVYEISPLHHPFIQDSSFAHRAMGTFAGRQSTGMSRKIPSDNHATRTEPTVNGTLISRSGGALCLGLLAAACGNDIEVPTPGFVRVVDGPAVTNHASTGGVTWVDYDADGDLDLYVTNGYDVSASTPHAQGNRLYRNEGGTFVADRQNDTPS